MKLIAIFISLIASLQIYAQPSIGITAGLNLPWQLLKGEGGQTRFNILPSFNTGFVADFPLSQRISIQPSLLVSGKGGQKTSTAFNITATRKISLYYLELPLIVNYAILAKDYKILLGAGAAISYGVSGKIHDYTIDNSQDSKFDPFNEYFRKPDAGIICQIAYRKKTIMISGFGDFGVANIFNNDNPNLAPASKHATWTNSAVGISVAYLFKLKK